ncbi:hypothetical protein TNCV_2014261 [Trichonephila clavipes]|nr:hypothetical protein TNCV_2014261 [Trichonephila clavipes]
MYRHGLYIPVNTVDEQHHSDTNVKRSYNLSDLSSLQTKSPPLSNAKIRSYCSRVGLRTIVSVQLVRRNHIAFECPLFYRPPVCFIAI